MNPLVSIIIPVYKSEDRIEQCIRSLFGQTYRMIEYIFIDDFSEEQEMIILETVIKDYPARIGKVKQIKHSANRGSASSRNDGIKVATGKYITFCDSDDWIDPNGIKEVVDYIENTQDDIVITNFYYEEDKGRTLQYQQFQGMNHIDLVRALIVGDCHGSTCNKIYRRDFLLKSQQWFIDGADLYEDLCWNMRLFLMTEKISCAPITYYHYQMFDNNSLIHTQFGNDVNKRVKSFWQIVRNYNAAIAFFKQSGYYVFLKEPMKQRQLKLRLRLADKNDLYNKELFMKLYPETNRMLLHVNRKMRWRIALFLLAYGISFPYELLIKKGEWFSNHKSLSGHVKMDN